LFLFFFTIVHLHSVHLHSKDVIIKHSIFTCRLASRFGGVERDGYEDDGSMVKCGSLGWRLAKFLCWVNGKRSLGLG
jgi:hypothetical protein